jgi:hypothetical protein
LSASDAFTNARFQPTVAARIVELLTAPTLSINQEISTDEKADRCTRPAVAPERHGKVHDAGIYRRLG